MTADKITNAVLAVLCIPIRLVALTVPDQDRGDERE